MDFIFLHDCIDCKYEEECQKEKSSSTDCKEFEYK